MIVGVVIDDWKQDIVKRHLTKAGFKFTIGQQPVPKSVALIVETDEVLKLSSVVQDALEECKVANN